jgi:hypothetical protein
MTENNEDIFKTMNATKVLVAILNKIGSVEVPTEDFINANKQDSQLSVTYNSENLSFEFKLEPLGSQSDYELAND